MPPRATEPADRLTLRQALAAAGVGIAAAVAVLLLWAPPDEPVTRADRPAPAPPPPLPPRPETTPVAALPPRLSEALDLMAAGRLREAQRLMLDFRRGPSAATLPPEHRETMTAMLAKLANDPVLTAAAELERGFRQADLGRLRVTLGGLAREQMIALRRDPQAARRVDDTRRLAAEADAIEALLDSDRVAALRLAQDFRRRHPSFAASLHFEARAAAAIDATAGRLIAANRLDEAKALLLELQALRGDQAGESPRVEARLQAIDEVFQRQGDLEARFRAIEATGRKRPHEALAILSRMERTPENRNRLAQLESTLDMLMEDLDQGAPQVEVEAIGTVAEIAEIRTSQDPGRQNPRQRGSGNSESPAAEPDVYDGSEDVTLRVRATDDYEVVSLRLFWRWFDQDGVGEVVETALWPAAGASSPASKRPAGDETDGGADLATEVEFEATITAAEHRGRNLQVWAEAGDRGGRIARSSEHELSPAHRGLLKRLGLRRGRQP